MSYEYLNGLGLSREAEATIRSLGARTASALLSILEHSRDKFVRFLGSEQTERLHEALLKIVPPEDREKLKSLPEFKPKFGALRVSQSESPETASAQQERDRLMRDIKQLRDSEDDSPEKHQLLEHLEDRLRNLLKSTVAAN